MTTCIDQKNSKRSLFSLAKGPVNGTLGNRKFQPITTLFQTNTHTHKKKEKAVTPAQPYQQRLSVESRFLRLGGQRRDWGGVTEGHVGSWWEHYDGVSRDQIKNLDIHSHPVQRGGPLAPCWCSIRGDLMESQDFHHHSPPLSNTEAIPFPHQSGVSGVYVGYSNKAHCSSQPQWYQWKPITKSKFLPLSNNNKEHHSYIPGSTEVMWGTFISTFT